MNSLCKAHNKVLHDDKSPEYRAIFPIMKRPLLRKYGPRQAWSWQLTITVSHHGRITSENHDPPSADGFSVCTKQANNMSCIINIRLSSRHPSGNGNHNQWTGKRPLDRQKNLRIVNYADTYYGVAETAYYTP
jgi:hypothetical protein